jgi:hypothetical protein
MKRPAKQPNHDARIEKANYPPSDYGRIVRSDGSKRWWVRSSNGIWIALRHQRVVENDDGSITLLLLRADYVTE